MVQENIAHVPCFKEVCVSYLQGDMGRAHIAARVGWLYVEPKRVPFRGTCFPGYCGLLALELYKRFVSRLDTSAVAQYLKRRHVGPRPRPRALTSPGAGLGPPRLWRTLESPSTAETRLDYTLY